MSVVVEGGSARSERKAVCLILRIEASNEKGRENLKKPRRRTLRGSVKALEHLSNVSATTYLRDLTKRSNFVFREGRPL
jgi:hypothetical protein